MERKAGVSGHGRMGAVRAGTLRLGGPIFGMWPWAFGAVRGFCLGWAPAGRVGGPYRTAEVPLPVVAPRWV